LVPSAVAIIKTVPCQQTPASFTERHPAVILPAATGPCSSGWVASAEIRWGRDLAAEQTAVSDWVMRNLPLRGLLGSRLVVSGSHAFFIPVEI